MDKCWFLFVIRNIFDIVCAVLKQFKFIDRYTYYTYGFRSRNIYAVVSTFENKTTPYHFARDRNEVIRRIRKLTR